MGFGDSLSLTVTGFISGPKSIMFGEKKNNLGGRMHRLSYS